MPVACRLTILRIHGLDPFLPFTVNFIQCGELEEDAIYTVPTKISQQVHCPNKNLPAGTLSQQKSPGRYTVPTIISQQVHCPNNNLPAGSLYQQKSPGRYTVLTIIFKRYTVPTIISISTLKPSLSRQERTCNGKLFKQSFVNTYLAQKLLPLHPRFVRDRLEVKMPRFRLFSGQCRLAKSTRWYKCNVYMPRCRLFLGQCRLVWGQCRFTKVRGGPVQIASRCTG